MEIVLIFMLMWCAALLWCSLKETARSAQFVLTVVCLSGGILFFSWYLFTEILFRTDSHLLHQWEDHYKILCYLIIFLTIVYAVRVVGGRIDKRGKK